MRVANTERIRERGEASEILRKSNYLKALVRLSEPSVVSLVIFL